MTKGEPKTTMHSATATEPMMRKPAPAANINLAPLPEDAEEFLSVYRNGGNVDSFLATLSPGKLVVLKQALASRLAEIDREIWLRRRKQRDIGSQIEIVKEDAHRLTTAADKVGAELRGFFGRIYRYPDQAIQTIWAFEKKYGAEATAKTLKQAPRLFGALVGFGLPLGLGLGGRVEAMSTAASSDYAQLREKFENYRSVINKLKMILGE